MRKKSNPLLVIVSLFFSYLFLFDTDHGLVSKIYLWNTICFKPRFFCDCSSCLLRQRIERFAPEWSREIHEQESRELFESLASDFSRLDRDDEQFSSRGDERRLDGPLIDNKAAVAGSTGGVGAYLYLDKQDRDYEQLIMNDLREQYIKRHPGKVPRESILRRAARREISGESSRHRARWSKIVSLDTDIEASGEVPNPVDSVELVAQKMPPKDLGPVVANLALKEKDTLDSAISYIEEMEGLTDDVQSQAKKCALTALESPQNRQNLSARSSKAVKAFREAGYNARSILTVSRKPSTFSYLKKFKPPTNPCVDGLLASGAAAAAAGGKKKEDEFQLSEPTDA
jgi:hypothetical protein